MAFQARKTSVIRVLLAFHARYKSQVSNLESLPHSRALDFPRHVSLPDRAQPARALLLSPRGSAAARSEPTKSTLIARGPTSAGSAVNKYKTPDPACWAQKTSSKDELYAELD